MIDLVLLVGLAAGAVLAAIARPAGRWVVIAVIDTVALTAFVVVRAT